MAKIISILSNKGGDGKSTTCLNLAYGLCQKGKKVLFVDNDPQSNATSILMGLSNNLNEQSVEFYQRAYQKYVDLGNASFRAAFQALEDFVNKNDFEHDIHDVIEGQAEIEDTIVSTRYEHLDLLPATHKLATSDLKLKSKLTGALNVLRKALNKVEDKYDVIIIDNQPFENSLTLNALTACHKSGDLVIIPTKIDRGGLEGTYSTLNSCYSILEEVDLDFDVKLLITMMNRNKVDQKWVEALQQTFQDAVFEPIIRYQAKPISDSSMHHKPVLEMYPKSSVALDYQKLVDTIIKE